MTACASVWGSVMQADRYSRMVSLLKVVFPLMALGLLSTLFLLSRVIDPGATIPFADKDIQDRLRNQQVTGPFFSGTTADGDLISFSADALTTPKGQTDGNEAIEVRAELDLKDGARITLQSDNARFDLAADLAELTGDVRINTDSGYRIISDLLKSEMADFNLESPGPVEASGPPGTLTAGSMSIVDPEGADGPQLIFTNGVKLVYTPNTTEE
tara:strand:- start:89200 stop:89841 length:642 start_codon:yes stop_codon:yes gene_type:complete